MLGSDAFRRGNSGSSLQSAVVKLGADCQQEGAYCELLGVDVAPIVYAIIPGGYVMERLERPNRGTHLLIEIERLLRINVWKHPAVHYEVTGKDDFREYHTKLRWAPPEWAIPTSFCRCHGDPTVSNAMRRWDGSLVLIDPRAPRHYIPQARETDMGRLLQSALGWEEVAYGDSRVEYVPPLFWDDPTLRRKALYWCGATAKRIEKKEMESPEPREHILHWCLKVQMVCLELFT